MQDNTELKRKNYKQIGTIGEAKILAKIVEFGIPVYIQFGDNEAADYVIIVDNVCLKCQVKTTRGTTEKAVFSLTRNNYLSKQKFLYTTDEVDLFLLYDRTSDECFIVKNDGIRKNITIRYTATKNFQKEKVCFYKDFLLSVETLHQASKAFKNECHDEDKVRTTM